MLIAGRHRLLVGVCFAACVVADMGDDLANNLPADLAPVGGPTWLRAIIGRARESFAVVEAEVMSSTSHEVCELWNGQEVVRVMGEGLIREFIIMVPAGSDWDDNSATVETKDQDEYLNERGFTIQERIFGKLDIEEGIGHARKDGLSVVIIRRKETEDNKEHETKDIAPNLTLNIHSCVGRGELYAVALFGILVQLGILAYYACSTYYPPFRFYLLNKEDVIENYAFSCIAAGTTLIVAGMLICSLIVEKSTSEKRYLPISKATEARIVWLQRPGTVNDQTFESFAIYPESPQAVITTSRRASRTRSQGRETSSDKSWWERVSGWEFNEVLTLMGMFLSISGFIVQFVGLRAMHWTASITLLGATMLMTCLRVLVRRNLAKVPKSQRLIAGHELDWLTMTLAGDVKNAPWMSHPKVDVDGLKRTCADSGGWDWRISSVENPKILNKLCPASDTDRYMKSQQTNQSVGQTLGLSKQTVKAHNRAMKIREDLGGLANWHGPAYAEAIVLARAIEMTMDTLLKPHPANPLFTWSLTARWPCGGPNSESIDFLVRLENQKWKVSSNEIDAALSLWLYSVYKDEKILGNVACDGAGVRTTEMMEECNLRLLGSHTPALQRDLRWWMPDGAIRVIEVGSDSKRQHRTTVEVKPHQVVGFASNPELGSAEGRIYLFDDAPGETGNGNGTLAVESYSPLKKIYTQHMFSAFMWALAKAMEPIPTRAEIRLKDTGGLSNASPWQFLSFHNTTLSKLAKNIQSAGLGSLEEVYLAIIPPLSAWNKLPRADAIVEWTRKHTKRHEQLGHWKEATDAYLWLFEASKTFSEQSNKATAVLMEYLRTVTLAVELKGAQAYGEEDTKRLMKEKWRLETELKTADQEVLSSLMRLYTGEGRGWKCDVVQGTGSGAEEDPPYPKVFNFVPLHQSVRRSDINGISKILAEPSEGPDPKDIHDCTPLHYAAAMGCKKATEELLRGGAHVNARDFVEWTPLHHAAANGYEDVVGLLIELGADEHSRDRFDGTPLHIAAANGHKEVASLLIQQGADTNFRDCSGGTSLHRAAASGHKDVVSLLVAKGADKEVKDRFGETPPYRAAKAGHKDTVIELLGDKMNDLVQTLLSHAAERGHKTVVRLAVNGLGAEKNVKDRSGRTPLHSAAAKGHKAVVRLLINEGADKNATDSSGETALCCAVKAGHVDIVRLLVSSGEIDVDLSSAGQTPLSYAVEGGNEAIVKLLLDSGKVDINVRSSSGRTPLSYAAERGHEAIVKLLLDSGKADIDSSSKSGRTPLSYAAERGHEAIVKLLLDSDKVDIDSKDSLDRVPLSYAAERGHEAVVGLLVNSGKVDIDSSSNSGQTPLSYAAERGHEAVVRLLLGSGEVDIESKSKAGWTPLSYAAKGGHEAVVGLLLDSDKADISIRSDLHTRAQPGKTTIIASERFDGNGPSSGQDITWYGQFVCKPGQSKKLAYFYDRHLLADAVYYGKWEEVKALLDHSRWKYHQDWVNCWRILPSTETGRTTSGFTPLHQAAWWGNERVVQELLQMGAWRLARTLRNTSDSEGHSRPLDIARGREWEHLYEFLDPEIKRPVDPKVLQALQDRLHSLIRQTFGDNRQAHLECFILPELEVLTEFEDSGMWFPLNPELPDSRQELAVHISLEHDELIVIIQLGRNERRNYRISSTGVTQLTQLRSRGLVT
ncbi:ankyrin repeat [Fusarium beomiforme]|uniref:Ankyrin repeat n=1 Tax=Fusarium beomiforme TaxID=44412 RepID=A0A9P5A6T8_9HYPO|nr:ankyrin repeat [Fusarium beomiforme]